jgi:fructose-1,6-bisphosphatase/inositol monophosphatase family enzyme
VLPRFRSLREGDIEEKGPGDFVTIVDREVEAALLPLLGASMPGSRMVGEEAAFEDPRLLSGLDRGWVWVVDPLDGTANFVAGREDFAIMVGLLREGEPVAGWILAPVSGQLFVAESGGGAFVDGRRLAAVPTGALDGLRGVAMTRHLPVGERERWERSAEPSVFLSGFSASGADYPALVTGQWGFLFYWRTFPWDHVPGSLLVQEAGGRVSRLDGSPYRPADGRAGLLATHRAQDWPGARGRIPI